MPGAILALLLQAAAPAVPLPPHVSWLVTHTIVKGSAATATSAWSADGNARLVVRCDTTGAPIVSLQFIPRAGFPAATPRPVSINVDGNGWLGTNWQFPGTGAFVSDDTVVANLAVMVAQGKSIRVRASAPDDGIVEATFAGPASDAPVRAVLTACGYAFGKPPPRSTPTVPAPSAAKTETVEDE